MARDVQIVLGRVLGALMSVLGVGLGYISLAHALREHHLTVGAVVGGYFPAVLALVIVAEGVILSQRRFETRALLRVVGWGVAGIASSGLLAIGLIAYEQSHGTTLFDAQYLVTNSVTAGAAGGFLIGYFDAQWHRRAAQLRAERETLADEREKLELLNRILHHDIGNDLTVILGMAEMVESHVDEEGAKHLTRLQRAATDAVDVTRTAREFVSLLDSDIEREVRPMSLREILETQVENARATYPQATIDIERPVPDVEVMADEMLSSVFRNLVTNAIQHSDTDDPDVECTATVEEDVVRVRVADNGPGIPDERKEGVFARGESVLGEDVGLGLYLVNQLVEDYGGEVWVEDSDMGGAAFVVELARAESVHPADGNGQPPGGE